MTSNFSEIEENSDDERDWTIDNISDIISLSVRSGTALEPPLLLRVVLTAVEVSVDLRGLSQLIDPIYAFITHEKRIIGHGEKCYFTLSRHLKAFQVEFSYRRGNNE